MRCEVTIEVSALYFTNSGQGHQKLGMDVTATVEIYAAFHLCINQIIREGSRYLRVGVEHYDLYTVRKVKDTAARRQFRSDGKSSKVLRLR